MNKGKSMSDPNNKSNPDPKLNGATMVKPRAGLRLIKTAPSDIIAEITSGGLSNSEALRKAQVAAKAKNNPLVRQLSNLADALDAEVAMILKM